MTDGEGEEVPRSWGARGRLRVSAAGRARAGRRIADGDARAWVGAPRVRRVSAASRVVVVVVVSALPLLPLALLFCERASERGDGGGRRVRGFACRAAPQWVCLTQRALDPCGGTCCYDPPTD